MADRKYYVQSAQVRGERRSYWIESRGRYFGRNPECVQDFGTNKRAAEKRCDELNRALSNHKESGR